MRWREACLDALLVVQVAASLVLSGLLAYRFTPELPVTSRPQVVPVTPAQSVPRADLLQPVLIWAYTETGGYGGVTPGGPEYPVAWQRFREAIRLALATPERPAPVSSLELEAAEAQPAVGADLPLRLPAAELAGLWVRQEPAWLEGRLRPDLWPATPVDRLVIGLGEPGGLYLVGPAGALRLSLPQAARPGMEELAAGLTGPDKVPYRRLQPLAAGGDGPAGEGAPEPGQDGSGGGPVGGDAAAAIRDPGAPAPLRVGPWVLVPDGRPGQSRPVPAVRWRPAGDPRGLLPLFFPDQTVVREVEELGGARIYTDGRRALRVYSTGALEYTESQPREPAAAGPGLPDAVAAVLEFAGSRSLWPAAGVLTGVEETRWRRRLFFGFYRDGLPVLGGRPLLEAIVAGGRVTYLYAAHTLEIGDTDRVVELVPPEAAVAAAHGSRHLAGEARSPAVVHRVHLAWRLEPATLQRLVPVWVVTFREEGPVLVDAESGQVLP